MDHETTLILFATLAAALVSGTIVWLIRRYQISNLTQKIRMQNQAYIRLKNEYNQLFDKDGNVPQLSAVENGDGESITYVSAPDPTAYKEVIEEALITHTRSLKLELDSIKSKMSDLDGIKQQIANASASSLDQEAALHWQSQYDQLQKQFQTTNQDLLTSQAEVQRLTRQLKSNGGGGNNPELERQYNQLLSRFGELERSKERAESAYRELQQVIQSGEGTQGAQEEALIAQLQDMEKSNQTLRSELEQAERKVSDTSQSWEVKYMDLLERLEKTEHERKEALALNSELSSQSNSSSAQEEQLKTQINHLSRQLEEAENDRADLVKVNEKLSREIQTALSKTQESEHAWEKKYNELLSQKEENAQSQSNWEQQQSVLMNQMKQVQQERNTLEETWRAKYKALLDQYNDYKHTHKSSSDSLDSLKQELESTRLQLAEAEDRKENELQQLKLRMVEWEQSAQDAGRRVSELERVNGQMEADFANREKVHIEAAKRWESKYGILMDKYRYTEQQLEDAITDGKMHESENVRLAQELQRAKGNGAILSADRGENPAVVAEATIDNSSLNGDNLRH